MKSLPQKDIEKEMITIIEGFHSGFPECCILEFTYDIINDPELKNKRWENLINNIGIHNDIYWVPCDKHCKEFINNGVPNWARELPKKNGNFFNEQNEINIGRLGKERIKWIIN